MRVPVQYRGRRALRPTANAAPPTLCPFRLVRRLYAVAWAMRLLVRRYCVRRPFPPPPCFTPTPPPDRHHPRAPAVVLHHSGRCHVGRENGGGGGQDAGWLCFLFLPKSAVLLLWVLCGLRLGIGSGKAWLWVARDVPSLQGGAVGWVMGRLRAPVGGPRFPFSRHRPWISADLSPSLDGGGAGGWQPPLQPHVHTRVACFWLGVSGPATDAATG